MFSIVLLTIAVVAIAQFALYYWRAVIAGVAAEPVSSRVFEAAHVAEPSLSGADFHKLLSLHKLTPRLQSGDGGLLVIRAYYAMMSQMDALFGRVFPALSAWSQSERVLCARYAAVQIEHRLQNNLAHTASIHSC